MQGRRLEQRQVASSLLRWGHVFCLTNVFIALIIAVPFLLLAPKPSSPQSHIYHIISWIGHVGFLNFIVYLLALFPFSILWPKPRFILFYSTCIATFAQTLLFLDTEVFRIFKFHLNPTVLSFLLQLPVNEFPRLFYKTSLFFLFIGALEFLCAYRLYRYITHKKHDPRMMRISTACILLAFVSTHISHIWADAVGYTPITVHKPSFPLSYPMTAKTFLTKYGWLHTQDYQTRTATLLHTNNSQYLNYPTTPIRTKTPPARHNILLLVVRDLPYAMLSKTVMPHLFAYSQSNLNFTQHYSGSNLSELAPYTLFYSLTPNYWSGISHVGRPPVVIEELLHQDYQLGFFSTGSFETKFYTHGIHTPIRTQTPHNIESKISTNKGVLHRWQAWRSQIHAARPWFSYLEIAPKTGTTLKRTTQNMTSLDLEQMYDVDQLIGDVLRDLQLSQHEKDTIVIITSDTGHTALKHNTASKEPHLHPDSMHIPFIMSWPEHEPRTITHQTSHFDLAPTLLKQALGTNSNPMTYALGQDLLTDPQRTWILASNATEYAIYDGHALTTFNLEGEFEVFENNKRIKKQPNMTLVMHIMDDLSRFNHEH